MAPSWDFNTVCGLAGYDGSFVKEHYRTLVNEKQIVFSHSQLKFIRNYWINVSKKK